MPDLLASAVGGRPTALPASLPGASAQTLEWRDGEILRDGAPHRILAGAVHYFRVHPDLWEDRLRRLAAMGANTVDTYVAWNFHERVEGDARFDGWRDVERFIRIASEVGLDVFIRPSPYICAEWSNGGIPFWLSGRTAALRTSDADFLAAVDRWYDRLIPRLVPLQAVHGGPIVAVQVENEYGCLRQRPRVPRAPARRTPRPRHRRDADHGRRHHRRHGRARQRARRDDHVHLRHRCRRRSGTAA